MKKFTFLAFTVLAFTFGCGSKGDNPNYSTTEEAIVNENEEPADGTAVDTGTDTTATGGSTGGTTGTTSAQ
jgi:hypothetical protein